MQIIFWRRKHLLISLLTIILLFLGIGFAFSLPQLTYRFSKINKTVVIDAGHGSIDAGASYHDLEEKDINLKVAFILKELLEKSNIKVVMTRTDDSLYNKSRHDDIIYRARLTKEVQADAFISIHCNKFPTPEPFGGQAYYHAGEDSKLLAQLIQEQLKLIQPDNYRSIGRGNYYVLKKAPCPANIIEIGFISNPVDRKRLTDPQEKRRIATAIRNGLIAFFYHDYVAGNNIIEESYQPPNHKLSDLSSGYNLYFAQITDSQEKLVPIHTPIALNSTVNVAKSASLTSIEILAVNALEKLIAGPKNVDLISVIPPGTELISIQVQDGLAILNFNQALISNHWGGAEAEKATVASIVKTLTAFPGIDKILILVEGRSGQSIAGHIFFDEPLSAEMF